MIFAMLFALALVFVVPAALIWLIYRQTRTRSPLGLGPVKVMCPHCDKPQAFLRLPTTADEIFFGGYTCGNCGCRIHKYGRERFAKQR